MATSGTMLRQAVMLSLRRTASYSKQRSGGRRRLLTEGSSSSVEWLPSISSSMPSSSLSSNGAARRSISIMASSPSTAATRTPATDCFNPSPSRYQQVRWKGRNDGAKYANRTRKPTKKQRKKYNRHLKKIRMEKEKHSPPGSIAGFRREWAQMEKDQLLKERDMEEEKMLRDDYVADDALLDDLMGNTSMAQPTPEPAYLGHRQRYYFNRVADQMDDYRKYRQQIVEGHTVSSSSSSSDSSELAVVPADLPSDKDISLALRAFRDRNGTKQRPVGIIAALQHVIQDMGVPLGALDQLSYTALLTCCRTEPEARRIFQLMRDQQVPINAYCWSILVDIHAKLGDYEGCVRIHEEMKQTGGLAPTLASYTSLLAACYKVCNDGRVAHSIRAKAAEVAWQNWMEMRIIGVEADAMAFGAMLRVLAAQGLPEKAINILEEMPRFEVKPTTLCFTSALRAVARSHETAIRYEGGASKRFRRREEITMHHGKLARSILIQAEEHGVEQDTGFVAALCLCAAAAGDVATAKAIYVASQIRKLDQFRTIGPNSHLARLRGEDVPLDHENAMDLLPAGGGGKMSEQQLGAESLAAFEERDDGGGGVLTLDDEYLEGKNRALAHAERKKQYPSFGEREYGKDSRVLSAILLACARSSDKNGIGTMWQGRENNGLLCINSLRLIAAKWKPQMYDNEIPGSKVTDGLTWEGEHRDLEEYRPGKRSSRKFKGVDVDENAGSTLDDLDETFYKMFVNEDGRTKEEFRKSTPEDVWRLKYGDDDPYVVNGHSPHPLNVVVAEKAKPNVIPQNVLGAGTAGPRYLSDSDKELDDGDNEIAEEDDVVFDYETNTWKKRNALESAGRERHEESAGSSDGETSKEMYFDDNGTSSDSASTMAVQETETELYFDDNEMRWKTRPKQQTMASSRTKEVAPPESSDADADAGTEMYFDDNVMRWKTRPATKSSATASLVKHQSEPEKQVVNATMVGDDSSDLAENDAEAFSRFFAELKGEASEIGEEEVSEDEARELWAMMKDEYNEVMSMSPEEKDQYNKVMSMSPEELGLDSLSEEELSKFSREELSNLASGQLPKLSSDPLSNFDPSSYTVEQHLAMFDNETVDKLMSGELENVGGPDEKKQDISKMMEDLKNDWRDQGFDLDEDDDVNDDLSKVETMPNLKSSVEMHKPTVGWQPNPQFQPKMASVPSAQPTVITYDDSFDESSNFEFENKDAQVAVSSSEKTFVDSPVFNESVEVVDPESTKETDPKLEELRELMPAMSDSRLRRVLRVFKKNLGDPPLLELVPVVRENMPDYITNTWLKKMSALTANYVVQKASEDHLVDTHILNGVLEIHASHGGLDRAVDFHESEFLRHGLQPTGYSDRLVLQMFLKNNRLPRALAFKRKVEESGRSIDLKAYGSLVDYCSRRQQLGSAMLLVKECISVHGAPPGEAMLKQLRLLCRQNDLVDKLHLNDLLGEDPLAWLREGEGKLKRESSKKGRRGAIEASAAGVRI